MDVGADFPQALQCLFEPRRYKILYGGRGAGRSWGCARALLLIGAKRAIRVLCARELQKSLSESVHKLLSDHIMSLGLETFYTIQVDRIIGKNGTMFSFEGIKNNTAKVKSYEGIDYCWVEEASKVSKASWGVLIPTIRKTGSEIWMTFNPELEGDYTFTRFVKDPDLKQITSKLADGGTFSRMESDQAIVVKMTWRDNPWFGASAMKAEMEYARKTDPDHYMNVWEGNTIQVLEGAVYAKELRAAQIQARICNVPYSPEVPVDTFWDLGRADNTAIWFAQRVAMQYRVLAYFEDSGEDITYFLRECQRREYVYGTMHLPHDAKAKRLGSKRTIEEMVRQAGYRVSIVPKLSLSDGINAARLVLPNCWFDETECTDGLHALRHYRYKVTDGQLSNEPLHDGASDGADAFRYMAVALKSSSHDKGAGGVAERLRSAGSKVKTMLEAGRSGGNGLGWLG